MGKPQSEADHKAEANDGQTSRDNRISEQVVSEVEGRLSGLFFGVLSQARNLKGLRSIISRRLYNQIQLVWCAPLSLFTFVLLVFRHKGETAARLRRK